MDLPVEERILAGVFLCSDIPNETLAALKPEWNEKSKFSIGEKLSSFKYHLTSLFPWQSELSNGIDHEKFCESFFIQPDLFLRIRPHHAEDVLMQLGKIGVQYEFISPFTIRLPNSFKVDDYFESDKQVVIQDYNSQQIAYFLSVNHEKTIQVWDCCAASGGKSIMAYDINPNIDLTVSDVRESILTNLKKRFKHAGIKEYKSLIIDLANNKQPVASSYDLIIADVPCTGSGTWSRTPEQLFCFDKIKIEQYAELQKKIISNVIPSVKTGGHLLYITCSVFKKENEGNVSYIKENFSLELIKMEILKGYDKKADTLFAALFKKIS